MFEKLGSIFEENKVEMLLATILTAVIVGAVIVALQIIGVQPINAHDMGGGVVCYTFNDAIDCLQVAR